MALRDLVKGGLAALKSEGYDAPVRFDAEAGAYLDSSVYRGFPMGTPGSGGFGVDTAGGFIDLRMNNNWMRPVRHARGSFFAIACGEGKARQARILRRRFSGGDEYEGIPLVAHVRFVGRLPAFEQTFTDPDLPVTVSVRGFSPLVPHDERASTAPVACFDVTLTTDAREPLPVTFLFSWENVLGRGGTGETGVVLRQGVPVSTRGRMRYDLVAGNRQEPVDVGRWRGLVFTTAQRYPAASHRASVVGRYLLLARRDERWTLDYIPGWDAARDRPALLQSLAKGRDLRALKIEGDARQPAGAVAIHTVLSQEAVTVPFDLVWWTPDHTPERDPLLGAETGVHHGANVGHRYERSFGGPHAVSRWVNLDREGLYARATELGGVLSASTLPRWLTRSLLAAADSVVTNTVIPKDGPLHTLEAMDWRWYFGGLTGTNDQRIASHPYTATFLTELDRSEVDLFRRLAVDGAVPHGNGNCDLALETSDVPYGVPVQMVGALKAEPWPDLTMSSILQTHRLYRTAGGDAWMAAAWPQLMAQLDWLLSQRIHGVPEGGSTYDTLRFPGTFSYTATLWLATLEALLDLAPTFGADRVDALRAARRDAAQRIDDVLWHPKGFYRACEGRTTLFTGALAGEWFARWSGLTPVIPLERARSHLAHVHRAVIVPTLARARAGHAARGGIFEAVEADFDGRPKVSRLLGAVKVHGYLWQVVAYYAVLAAQVGMVPEALTTCEVLYERIWRGGWPWSADLYGEAGPVYMTHPTLWALPNALAGASLDVPRGRLSLGPRPGASEGEARLPFFFPGFWGQVEGGSAGRWALRILKHFGEPVSIRALRWDRGDGAPAREVDLAEPWPMEAGRVFPLPGPTG